MLIRQFVGTLERRPLPTPLGRTHFIMSFSATSTTAGKGQKAMQLPLPLSYILLTSVKLCYCIRTAKKLKCKKLSYPSPFPPFPIRPITALASFQFFFVPLRTLHYLIAYAYEKVHMENHRRGAESPPGTSDWPRSRFSPVLNLCFNSLHY